MKVSGLPVLFYKIVNMNMDMDRLKGLFWGLVACVIITLLCGCKATRYVPVETVKIDSVYVNRWNKDSVYIHDSIFVYHWKNEDTVYVGKVVTKYLYKDKARYDTVNIIRADSVQVPYPVEKKRGWWEKTRINLFPILVAAIAVLVFIVIWLARKVKPMKNEECEE